MNDITNMPEDALQRYLQDKKFQLSDEEKVELGKRCQSAASGVIGGGKDSYIRSAEDKLRTSQEEYENDLKIREASVQKMVEHLKPNPFEGVEDLMMKVQQSPTSILEALYQLVSPHVKDVAAKNTLLQLSMHPTIARSVSSHVLREVQEAIDPTGNPSDLKSALEVLSPRLSRLSEAKADEAIVTATKNALHEVQAIIYMVLGENPELPESSFDIAGPLLKAMSEAEKFKNNPKLKKDVENNLTALKALQLKVFGARPGIYFACGQVVKWVENSIKPTLLTSVQKDHIEKCARAILETAVDKGITEKLVKALTIIDEFLKNPKTQINHVTENAGPLLKEAIELTNQTFFSA